MKMTKRVETARRALKNMRADEIKVLAGDLSIPPEVLFLGIANIGVGPKKVILLKVGDKKVQVIKIVWELTGLPLKKSKELVDSVEAGREEEVAQMSLENAIDAVAQLRAVGASAEFRS